ncbi:MAG: response regulator transcription factor [Mariprofundaceae bacterium]|nr:response regulator transcription factor [Mariprofundaceae bacterium]
MGSNAAKMKPIDIQIVNEDVLICSALCYLLESYEDIKVVAESTSADDGYAHYADTHPDIVLLDMNISGENRFTFLQQLLIQDTKAKIIILSGYDNIIFPQKALALGALGYVTKNSCPTILHEAILKVANSERFIEEKLAQKIVLGHADNPPPEKVLTSREFEIFGLLAQGYNVQEIAKKLHLSPKTINVHRDHLQKKMHIKNSVQLVHQALKHGIKFL